MPGILRGGADRDQLRQQALEPAIVEPGQRPADRALPRAHQPGHPVVFGVRHHVHGVRHPVGVVEERGGLRDVEDVLVGEALVAQRLPVVGGDLVRRLRQQHGEIQHGALPVGSGATR